MRYPGVNEGRREYAIRLGCERAIYLFIADYAQDMGISMSAALRRLVLIGARCESEHGRKDMPTTYDDMRTGPSKINDEIFYR